MQVISHWASLATEVIILPPPAHAAVNRMVGQEGRFTAPSPFGNIALSLHADGVIQLIRAARGGPVSGGLDALQGVLGVMLKLSKHGLDIARLKTEAYVQDPAITPFEHFIRVRTPPSTLHPRPCTPVPPPLTLHPEPQSASSL